MNKSATAIICHNQKILLFQRDDIPTIPEPGKWQLPGGHIEDGESPTEAIKRELKEEVSFVPSVIKYIGAVKFMSIPEALNHNLTKRLRFFLSNYKDLLLEKMRAKSVPRVTDVKKASWIKALYYGLFW